MRSTLVCCVTLVLTGCATVTPVPPESIQRVLSFQETTDLIVSGANKTIDAKALIATLTPEEAVARTKAALSNRTKMIYSSGHGLEVEYTAADGKTWLWYRGNIDAVEGRWDARVLNGQAVVCFGYKNAWNPVTNSLATNSCWNAAAAMTDADVIDSRPGDPFNLASGQIPFRRSGEQIPAWPK